MRLYILKYTYILVIIWWRLAIFGLIFLNSSFNHFYMFLFNKYSFWSLELPFQNYRGANGLIWNLRRIVQNFSITNTLDFLFFPFTIEFQIWWIPSYHMITGTTRSKKMAYNLKDEEEVKEYLKNLHIEYQFGCYNEKNPEGEWS